MNVPFEKVNNQQEFERVVDKMQRETGFKLHESSKCGADSIYNVIGIDDDFDILLYDPSHDDNKHLKIISADEYLTGIKENFTLDDLEDGMAIEYRKGGIRFVFDGSLLGEVLFGELKDYNKDLSHYNNDRLDIIKVYKINKSSKPFSMLLGESNLTLIFDTEAHRRKSEIENEIKKLQEGLNNLSITHSAKDRGACKSLID